MIKRTLFFSRPAYLSTKHEQLRVQFSDESRKEVTVPIEDIGFVVLESPQITLTTGLLAKLMDHKAGVVTCNKQHLPTGFLQPLAGHTAQSERLRAQLDCSLPLQKNLWTQTVVAKISNQMHHLTSRGKPALKLKRWAREVRSNDTSNREAVAAAYYFQHLFDIEGFSRNQKGIPPNNLLNYGYAILRAVAARAIVSSGMLPALGIFHHNKYNPYCLADDVMEPYRPYVDALVCDIVQETAEYDPLTTELKAALLAVPAMDVVIDGKKSPLMNAMSRTTNSLYACFEGTGRKIIYPEFVDG